MRRQTPTVAPEDGGTMQLVVWLFYVSFDFLLYCRDHTTSGVYK